MPSLPDQHIYTQLHTQTYTQLHTHTRTQLHTQWLHVLHFCLWCLTVLAVTNQETSQCQKWWMRLIIVQVVSCNIHSGLFGWTSFLQNWTFLHLNLNLSHDDLGCWGLGSNTAPSRRQSRAHNTSPLSHPRCFGFQNCPLPSPAFNPSINHLSSPAINHLQSPAISHLLSIICHPLPSISCHHLQSITCYHLLSFTCHTSWVLD